MKKPANSETMNSLHEAVAQALTGLLKGRPIVTTEIDPETGDPTDKVEYAPPSAAELNVIVKFLKDNNITATPEQSSAVAGLEAALAKRKGARVPTEIDRLDAARTAGATIQ